jgi:hypothetical protein
MTAALTAFLAIEPARVPLDDQHSILATTRDRHSRAAVAASRRVTPPSSRARWGLGDLANFAL